MCLKFLKTLVKSKEKKQKEKNPEPISHLTLKIDNKIKEFYNEEDGELKDVKLAIKESLRSGKIDRKNLD